MTEVAADALSVVKAVAEPAAQSGGKHLVIFSKLFFLTRDESQLCLILILHT